MLSKSCPIKWPHDKSWSPCLFLLETWFWHGDLFRMYIWCSLRFGYRIREFLKRCNRGSWASVGIWFSLVYYFLLSQIPMLLIKASPLHNSYDYFCPIPLKSNAIVKCSSLPSIWTLPYLTAKQILRNCKATIHYNISSSSLPSANESLLPIDLWVLSLRAIPNTSFNLSSLESGASSLIPGKGSEGNQKWGRKRNYQ